MGTVMENGHEQVYGYIDLFKSEGDPVPIQMYPLTIKNINIGREHSCEIRIHNLRVSRLQCSLSISDETLNSKKVQLKNLTAKPTTIYKNQGIQQNETVDLMDGDRFRLYDTELRWRAYNPENKDGQPDRSSIVPITRLSLGKESSSPRLPSSKRKSDRIDKSSSSTRSNDRRSTPSSLNNSSSSDKGVQSPKRRRNSDMDMRKAVLKRTFRKSVQGKNFPATDPINKVQEGDGEHENDDDDGDLQEFEEEGDAPTMLGDPSSPVTTSSSSDAVNPIDEDLILLSPLVTPQVESSNDLIQFDTDTSYEEIEREMFALHHGGPVPAAQEAGQTSIALAVKISLSSETDNFSQTESSTTTQRNQSLGTNAAEEQSIHDQATQMVVQPKSLTPLNQSIIEGNNSVLNQSTAGQQQQQEGEKSIHNEAEGTAAINSTTTEWANNSIVQDRTSEMMDISTTSICSNVDETPGASTFLNNISIFSEKNNSISDKNNTISSLNNISIFSEKNNSISDKNNTISSLNNISIFSDKNNIISDKNNTISSLNNISIFSDKNNSISDKNNTISSLNNISIFSEKNNSISDKNNTISSLNNISIFSDKNNTISDKNNTISSLNNISIFSDKNDESVVDLPASTSVLVFDDSQLATSSARVELQNDSLNVTVNSDHPIDANSSDSDVFFDATTTEDGGGENPLLASNKTMNATGVYDDAQGGDEVSHIEETELIDIADDDEGSNNGVDNNIELVVISPYSQDQPDPSVDQYEDMTPEVVEVSDSPYVPPQDDTDHEEDDIIVPDTPADIIIPDTPDIIVPDTPDIIVPDTPDIIVPDTPDIIVPDTPNVIPVANGESPSQSPSSQNLESVQDVVSNVEVSDSPYVPPHDDTDQEEEDNDIADTPDIIVPDTPNVVPVGNGESPSQSPSRLSVDSIQDVVSDLDVVTVPDDSPFVEQNEDDEDSNIEDAMILADAPQTLDEDYTPSYAPFTPYTCATDDQIDTDLGSISNLMSISNADRPTEFLASDDEEEQEKDRAEIEENTHPVDESGEEDIHDVSENKENVVVSPSKHTASKLNLTREKKLESNGTEEEEEEEEEEEGDDIVPLDKSELRVSTKKSTATTTTKNCSVVLNQINVDHGSSSEEDELDDDLEEDGVVSNDLVPSCLLDIEVLSDRTNEPKTKSLNDSSIVSPNSTEPKLRDLSIVIQRLSMKGNKVVVTPAPKEKMLSKSLNSSKKSSVDEESSSETEVSVVVPRGRKGKIVKSKVQQKKKNEKEELSTPKTRGRLTRGNKGPEIQTVDLEPPKPSTSKASKSKGKVTKIVEAQSDTEVERSPSPPPKKSKIAKSKVQRKKKDEEEEISVPKTRGRFTRGNKGPEIQIVDLEPPKQKPSTIKTSGSKRKGAKIEEPQSDTEMEKSPPPPQKRSKIPKGKEAKYEEPPQSDTEMEKSPPPKSKIPKSKPQQKKKVEEEEEEESAPKTRGRLTRGNKRPEIQIADLEPQKPPTSKASKSKGKVTKIVEAESDTEVERSSSPPPKRSKISKGKAVKYEEPPSDTEMEKSPPPSKKSKIAKSKVQGKKKVEEEEEEESAAKTRGRLTRGNKRPEIEIVDLEPQKPSTSKASKSKGKMTKIVEAESDTEVERSSPPPQKRSKIPKGKAVKYEEPQSDTEMEKSPPPPQKRSKIPKGKAAKYEEPPQSDTEMEKSPPPPKKSKIAKSKVQGKKKVEEEEEEESAPKTRGRLTRGNKRPEIEIVDLEPQKPPTSKASKSKGKMTKIVEAQSDTEVERSPSPLPKKSKIAKSKIQQKKKVEEDEQEVSAPRMTRGRQTRGNAAH